VTQPNAIIFVIAIIGIASSGCGADDSNCEAFCSVIASCTDQSTQACLAECEEDLSEASDFSSACGAAANDRSMCVAGLTCEELEAWMGQVPPESYPCRDEEIAVDDEC
jgi:hypothetical protein